MSSNENSQEIKPTGYRYIEDLALNLRSSWNHSTDKLWRNLNPELWERTQNPWAVLQTASKKQIKKVLEDKELNDLILSLYQEKKVTLEALSWFDKNYSKSPLKSIVYFSMEFMLSEALPIYSGGLGNVAGDLLKTASDLGVPVIGIGLLYSQGYFRQLIDAEGNQREFYPYNNPGQLPIKPLRLANGERLRLKIEFPAGPLWLQTWEVKVGRRVLYLLDSNDIANFPTYRGITSELYGGDNELRLQQEIILGIGGWRLLATLGIEPDVCHLNEGHTAFAILERTLQYMQKTNESFETALATIREGNLFTTHTAQPSGFDQFAPELLSKYLGKYAQKNLKIPFEKLLALGQLRSVDYFNMAYLAIRGSRYVNGVSQLHAKITRNLFKNIFPGMEEEQIPVGYVTNGVHMPTWDAAQSDQLWTEACGKDRWNKKVEELEMSIRKIPDEKIWQMRNVLRVALVEYARLRMMNQLAERGASEEQISAAKTFLDPNVLTLGFARRFVAYKRPDLLLLNEERLFQILTNKTRRVQLLIAGKAHPYDHQGHTFIKRWMEFINRPEVRPSVIFLSDFDMILTEHLVQGVDLWINTPRRPYEACGTSGMKVLVNGGLNLSSLDGWWAESYEPEVGFALGNQEISDDLPNQDLRDAQNLYDLIENQIIPEFYQRDENNIPKEWIAKVRESMARLTPRFSSTRMVCEYIEKYYHSLATIYTEKRKRASS